jgi:molybdopterin/thiamine biosynthesis adenylyltransferase
MKVSLIGCGTLGSMTGLLLSKEPVKVTLYDDDLIERRNLYSQMFPWGSEEQPKAPVLAEVMRAFSPMPGRKVIAMQSRPDKRRLSKASGIIVSAVDSLESRRYIWETLRKSRKWDIYIDQRMGRDSGILFTLTPDQEGLTFERYESTLVESGKIKALCNEGTAYLAALTAGAAVAQLMNYLKYRRVCGARIISVDPVAVEVR